MKTWTKEELDTLKANYPTATNDRLAALIPGKSSLAIYKKAYKLGFRKTAEIEFLNRSSAKKREKASNWKGGKKKTTDGYMQILQPDHPRADSNGYVMEHIVVWENATSIKVPKNCCIHHLNGDKADNRIENLCMMLHKAHTVFHHAGSKRNEKTKQKISERKKKYA